MAPPNGDKLAALLRLPNSATVTQIQKRTDVQNLYETYRLDSAPLPKISLRKKATVKLAIESLENTGVDLVGIGGETIDRSNWTREHHCARLLLRLSNTLTTSDGPLRATKQASTLDKFFSALYEFYLKLRHSNAPSRKSKKPEIDPQSLLPAASSAETPTDPVDSVPNALSPEKGVNILWQWMSAPDEPVNLGSKGVKTLAFEEAKQAVDQLFDLSNNGHEFAKFVSARSDFEVSDEEAWLALIAQLAQDIVTNDLRQVTIEVHTMDLKSDLRPRLRIGGRKSRAAEVADMQHLLEDQDKVAHFRGVRQMLKEMEHEKGSQAERELDSTELHCDRAAETLIASDSVDVASDVASKEEYRIPNDPAAIAQAKARLEWLNSDRLYARDQLSTADMEEFGMEESKFGYAMTNMLTGCYLTFYQPPAIKALHDILKKNGAGMLCDDVGLGKTIQLMAVLNHAYNLRQRVPEAERGPAKPSLVVVPHSLLAQWAKEIKNFFPGFRVGLYYGNKYSGIDKGIDFKILEPLTHDHAVFDTSDESSARTIILTSLDTLAARNGCDKIIDENVWSRLATALNLQLDKVKSAQPWAKLYKQDMVQFLREYSVATDIHAPISDLDLRGKFGFIICDEAHKVKNEGASRAILMAALSDRMMPDPPKLLLATATPILNGIDDIFGLLQLLEDPRAWTNKRVDINGKQPTESDIWEEKWDGQAGIDSMRMTCKALEPFKEDINALIPRLRQALAGCMVRRSYGSKVAGKLVGEALPNTHTRVKQVEFRQQEFEIFLKMSQKRHKDLLKATTSGELQMSAGSVHDLSLAQVFLPLGESQKLGKKEQIEKFIKAKKTAWDMLDTLAGEKRTMPWFSNWMEKRGGMPDKNDNLAILRCFLEWSPKLRFVVDAVLELVVLQQEKVLLWAHFPAEQELIKLVIDLLPVNVGSYHAGLSVPEQLAMLEQFRSPDHKIQVLVGSAIRDYFGLNMQGACANCIFVSEPISHPRAQQQIGRILRLGAVHEWIRVIYTRLNSALDEYMALQNLRKALAPVGFRINVDLFGSKALADTENLSSDAVFRIGNVVAEGKGFAVLSAEQMADLNLPALTEAILAAMIAQCEITGSTALSEKELQVIRQNKIPKLNELLLEHEAKRGQKRSGSDMDNSIENTRIQIQAALDTEDSRAAWAKLSLEQQNEVEAQWPFLKSLDEED